MEQEPTLKWDTNNDYDYIILTKSNGVQYNLKKNETIQFNIPPHYICVKYNNQKIFAKIEDFIGYPNEGVWGVIISIFENNKWVNIAKNENMLSDIHFNEDIWNSIEINGV